MIVDIVFSESDQSFDCNFGEINNISDGGYERGYKAGYSEGYEAGYGEGDAIGYGEGYSKGKADGLAQRTYETWTFTLSDGSVVDKKVGLI